MTLPELLVVGYQHRDAAPWPIVAQVPPHVVVLRAPTEDLPAIARRARLAMARASDGSIHILGDEAVVNELDDAARLFIRAWRERPAEKSDRPGEGLAWDHPGFQPPDQPRQ